MISKYLRELFMAEFNDFWQKEVPGVVPTAGVPWRLGQILRGHQAGSETAGRAGSAAVAKSLVPASGDFEQRLRILRGNQQKSSGRTGVGAMRRSQSCRLRTETPRSLANSPWQKPGVFSGCYERREYG